MFTAFTQTIALDRGHEIEAAVSGPANRQRVALAERAETEPATLRRSPFAARIARFTRPHPAVSDALAIRLARAGDALALRRLGELDSKPALARELSARAREGGAIVAEVDGELVAAIDIEGGRMVADPFRPSAGAAELLRMRVAQLAAGPRPHRGLLVRALRPRAH
jgi:hypothetical protein